MVVGKSGKWDTMLIAAPLYGACISVERIAILLRRVGQAKRLIRLSQADSDRSSSRFGAGSRGEKRESDMRLVSFTRGGTASYGVILKDGRILDLPQAASLAGMASPGANMIAFIAGGASASQTARRLEDDAGNAKLAPAVSAASESKLTAPIPRPAKNVFCIGRNYKEHVAEGYRARGAEIKLPEISANLYQAARPPSSDPMTSSASIRRFQQHRLRGRARRRHRPRRHQHCSRQSLRPCLWLYHRQRCHRT